MALGLGGNRFPTRRVVRYAAVPILIGALVAVAARVEFGRIAGTEIPTYFRA